MNDQKFSSSNANQKRHGKMIKIQSSQTSHLSKYMGREKRLPDDCMRLCHEWVASMGIFCLLTEKERIKRLR